MSSGKSTQEIGKVIASNKGAVGASWLEAIKEQSGERVLDLMDESALSTEVLELLDSFIGAFDSEDYSDLAAPEFSESIRLLTRLSASRAELGFTPSETTTSIMCLKDALLKTLQSEFQDDPKVLHDVIIRMNKVVDQLALVTFEAYSRFREALITEQHLALEHSTPVISIWEGMLLMPLMGIIDTRRAQKVIETLLNSIVSTSSSVAIMDLTGVPAFDTRVAQHLLKTVSAAKMLGAEVIVTGVSPDAAQTLTKLGVDLNVLDTRGGLISGMEAGYRRLGKEIRDIEA